MPAQPKKTTTTTGSARKDMPKGQQSSRSGSQPARPMGKPNKKS